MKYQIDEQFEYYEVTKDIPDYKKGTIFRALRNAYSFMVMPGTKINRIPTVAQNHMPWERSIIKGNPQFFKQVYRVAEVPNDQFLSKKEADKLVKNSK